MRVGAMEFISTQLIYAAHQMRIAKLPVREVAKKTGLSEALVADWKIARRIKNPVHRRKFASVFGYDFNSGVRY